MRHPSVLAATMAVLFLAAACSGGGGEAPTVGGATDEETGATSPSSTGSPSEAATGGCEPDAPTSLSSDWQSHTALSGDFSFSYPAGWNDASGDIGAQAQELLASETLTELGFTGSESVPADVVQDPVSGDNLGAFQFDGVQSPTSVLYGRQEELYGALPFAEVLGTDLVACVGGDTATGLEIVATVQGEGERYQQLWYLERDGSLYNIYLDAADQSASSVLAEVFRTWQWSGS
ncbi:MAG: hypothetical protein ACXWWX_06415 [Actinomycetota bacterium]